MIPLPVLCIWGLIEINGIRLAPPIEGPTRVPMLDAQQSLEWNGYGHMACPLTALEAGR